MVIFLLSFLVLDGASKESAEAGPQPQLFKNTADLFSAVNRLISKSKHEVVLVTRARDVLNPEIARANDLLKAAMQQENHLYVYVVVTGRLEDFSDESFQRRLAIERDPAFEGRFRYRVLESPVSFGCQIFDETHWGIDFPPNPADLRGGAILFENHPEGARMISSFIRHQWIERPGITMSLDQAYAKWQVLQGSASASS